MGVITVMRTLPHTGEKIRFKLNMYSANCVAAIVHEFKEKDKETGQTKNMYTFWTFWNDIKQLERCLGLRKDYEGQYNDLYNGEHDWDNWTHIKLNVYYKEMLKVGELFAKAGHKVTLYYEEPKKETKQ